MLTGEIRKMLLIRARLEESGGGFDASMSYATFQARVLPRLMAPAVPFGRSPFETARGRAHPFALFQSAQRSSRFTAPELARALARAADVDVQLKTSAPRLETFTVYVGRADRGNVRRARLPENMRGADASRRRPVLCGRSRCLN